ncbi:MAG TPA: tetratricopeptide repeat protein, partial [Actinomycetes bacterium]|nr:tetratricopeptide repeat protein [Actinomycetes bacterium]
SLHLARALQAVALVEVTLTPTAAAVDAGRRSLELFERFGEPASAAFSKVLLAMAELQRRGPSGDAVRLVEEARAAFAETVDPWGEAYAEFVWFLITTYHQGLPDTVEEVAHRVLERFRALDDHWGLSAALLGLAGVARARGDVDGAVRWYEEALAAARDGGPLWVRSASLTELGGLVAVQGDDARATALLQEASALARRTGRRRGLAHAWNEMGGIARSRGDLERARQLHQEALAIVREVVRWSVPHTLAQLACAEARLGDLDDAEAHLQEAATLVIATPQPATAALVLVGQALVALGRGHPDRAALLLAAADATRERSGVAPVGAERHEADLARQAARSQLDPEAFQAAQTSGRGLATEAALRPAPGQV